MAENAINPFIPEDNQQDKIARFEDLTPAAKLEQLNAVKAKFMANNRDDTARGFVEITDISFVRQNDGKELYIVTIKEIDKENDLERERNEYYTIDSQTASLANIKQHTQQEIQMISTYDPELAQQIIEKQNSLDEAANSPDKISASDLQKVERAAEELGIPEEEIDEEASFEIRNDGVRFSSAKMPGGTDSKEVRGNQLLDDNTTLNNLIGKNYEYYKFIKTTSGQKIIIGINADGSFEQVDSNTLEIINEPTMNLIAENGQKVQDPVAVVLAFRVKNYSTKAFGIYNRGAEYGTFYAEGANQDGHMLGVKIDNVEPNDIYPNTREIFQKDDVNFELVKNFADTGVTDPSDMLNKNPNSVAPLSISPAVANELLKRSNLSPANFDQIVKEVIEDCSKNPNLDPETELKMRVIEFADQHDTITREEAVELQKDMNVDVFDPHEPDGPSGRNGPQEGGTY